MVVEIQQNDSSTGITDAIEQTANIGMSSRALKPSELEKGVSATAIAIDGIAIIVNHDNAIEHLASEQVKAIFTGELTQWSNIAK